MLNQKQVAQILDRCAARAHSVNATPASGKQCWFLAGLLVKANAEADVNDMIVNTSYVLTSRRASSMIEDCLTASAA